MAIKNLRELYNLRSEELYDIYINRLNMNTEISKDFKLSCKVFKYFFIEVEKFDRQHIGKITGRLAEKCGFTRIINRHKLSEIVLEAFKEFDIKPWEMTRVPDEYWDIKENRNKFVMWIFKTKNLDYNNLKDVKEASIYLNQRISSISGNMKKEMLVYDLIKQAIPNLKFERWEIECVKKWTIDESIRATKWLIEEQLNITKEEMLNWNENDIKQNIKFKHFLENGLEILLYKVDYSIIHLVNLAYKK